MQQPTHTSLQKRPRDQLVDDEIHLNDLFRENRDLQETLSRAMRIDIEAQRITREPFTRLVNDFLATVGLGGRVFDEARWESMYRSFPPDLQKIVIEKFQSDMHMIQDLALFRKPAKDEREQELYREKYDQLQNFLVTFLDPDPINLIRDCPWWNVTTPPTHYTRRCFYQQMREYIKSIQEKWKPKSRIIHLVSLGCGANPLPEECLVSTLERLGYTVELYLVDHIFHHHPPRLRKYGKRFFNFYPNLETVVTEFEEAGIIDVLFVGFNGQYVVDISDFQSNHTYRNRIRNEVGGVRHLMEQSFERHDIKHLNFTENSKGCHVEDWLKIFSQRKFF